MLILDYGQVSYYNSQYLFLYTLISISFEKEFIKSTKKGIIESQTLMMEEKEKKWEKEKHC